MTSADGDTIRDVATDVEQHFPDYPEVVRYLRRLARRYDLATDTTQARRTRGRWVRRTRGNAGPGVPGLGHIAGANPGGTQEDAEALCGATLRGRLDWGPQASSRPAPPDETWRPCPSCMRAVATATTGRVAA